VHAPVVSEYDRFRRAGPKDAAAVRNLTRAAYAKWVPLIGREPKPMVADYDAAVRNHLIDLLYSDDELAALIEMIPASDHLLIENVAVRPDCQARGYGRALMTHAETVAGSLGLSETRLYTNKHFVTNVRFYQKLGYGIDREQEFKGGVVVFMSKRL
jgi:ribosomal protein S18 acetylase RimI-like enzyme